MSESLGKNLQALRKSKGVTQAEIAQWLGMSQNAYSAWEKSKSIPSIDKLIKVADFFNVSIDSICGRKAANSFDPSKQASRADLLIIASSLADMLGIPVTHVLMESMHLAAHYNPHDLPKSSMDWIDKYVNDLEQLNRVYDNGLIQRDVVEAWQEKQLREMEKIPLRANRQE